MRKVALAYTLQEWDSLIAEMDKHPELQTPQFREMRDALAVTAEMTRILAIEQQNLEGRRQVVTKQLQGTKGEGQDLVIKIRAALKSRFGHRWAGLALFRIRPIRGRSRTVADEFGGTPLPVADIRNGAVPAPGPAAAVQEAPPAGARLEPAPREGD
jgi:hypothetical protein